MSDSEIINNFLKYEFPDEHPAIYQYIKGGVRSKETAVNRMLTECEVVLIPPYSSGHVRTVIRRFLRLKRQEYLKGELKIKPIY